MPDRDVAKLQVARDVDRRLTDRVPCGECKGRGHVPGADPGTSCPVCHGDTEIPA